MKFLFVLVLTVFSLSVLSQDNNTFRAGDELPLTVYDSVLLSRLPELAVPDGYGFPQLPYKLDNSVFPYFRPVFNQVGPSCGQSAGIVYNFTYEMDRARNLPADTSVNQYPSHFTYNFMNNGNGWYGVSYIHSFEILKTLGTPTIYEYGGLAIDDGIIWITGYDKYYAAMKNRLRKVNIIKAGTPEGLETLKYWLFDHLEGSPVGGIVNFYAVSPWNYGYLADGTPEAGSTVIYQFNGTQSNHAMTIIGYNDSIRWDYNGDGQYTNNIDINGDGVVDMHDWEIGGIRFANSYGNNWADSGYCYMMYKLFADEMYEGGIWNHTVHVLDVKAVYEPELTAKISLKYDSRGKIKVMAGISADTSSYVPEHILNFPVFNYQGGNNYMQGGREEEEKKTIEFGLDLTPLLTYTHQGAPVNVFLLINEVDPLNEGTGVILRYSIIDYNNGANEILCTDENIPVKDNDVTILSIPFTPTTQKVNIVTEELPVVVNGQPYEAQLEAQQGTEPYQWEVQNKYYQQKRTAGFPQIEDVQLELPSNDIHYAEQQIDFDFPFYGKSYNTLYIDWDGFILFDKEIFPWPYYNDPFLLFKKMKNIAVFLSKPVKYCKPVPKGDEGMWYEGDETHAAFRWKKTLYNPQMEEVGKGEFAVILYPDGKIEYYYNYIDEEEPLLWYAGVSTGDDENYKLVGTSNTPVLPKWSSYSLTPDLVPGGLTLDKSGLLTGTPQLDDMISNLTVRVTDDHAVSDVKTLQLSDGLIYSCVIKAGNDSIVQFGEEIKLDVTIKNISAADYHNVNMQIESEDPNVEIVVGSTPFGDIPAGGSVTVEDAFLMQVSDGCPDEYTILINTELAATEALRHGKIFIETHAPELVLTEYRVSDDNNNQLDPGETADIFLTLINKGSTVAEAVSGELVINDPYITINQPSNQSFGDMKPGECKTLTYSVTADSGTPWLHEALFDFEITIAPDIMQTENFSLIVGRLPLLLINKAQSTISADAFQVALDSIGIQYDTCDTIPGNIDLYTSVLLCLGTFYTSAPLSEAEGNTLAEFLDGGGNLYMEGTVTWYLDPATAVHSKFHVTKIDQPWFSFEQLTGVSGTFTEGMAFDFSGSFTLLPYYLEPQDEAFPVFMLDTSSYLSCAVAYENDMYKTVAAMLEFGSLMSADTLGERQHLLVQILKFFGLDDYFVGIDEHEHDHTSALQVNCTPNPFGQRTTFEFSLNRTSTVEIAVFDLNGRPAGKPMSRQRLNPGNYSINWEPQNSGRKTLQPGVYLYRVKTDSGISTGKIIKIN